MNKKFKVIDTVFEGMLFDVAKPPTVLHSLFNRFSYLKIEIITGVYFVSFRNLFIASIKDYQLELTAGFFLHHEKLVFKTYNKLLRVLVKEKYFIKFINNKWILCKENL